MKTIFLILALSLSTFAQCTAKGAAVWDISPWLTQLCGRAGFGDTQVTFLMQGYTGVAYLSAPTIEMYGNLYLNGKLVIVGPPDSGGVGYRALVVGN